MVVADEYIIISSNTINTSVLISNRRLGLRKRAQEIASASKEWMPGIQLTSLATSRTADCKLVVKHAFPAVMVSCFLTSVIRGDSKS